MEAVVTDGTSLGEYLGGLPDAEREEFGRVVQVLNSISSPGKVARLSEFLGDLKKEIDDINKRRAILGEDLDLVERCAARVRSRAAGKASPELTLLISYFQHMAAYLKDEIESQRPDNKLAKKADVQRRISTLQETQRVAQALFEALSKTNGHRAGV